MENSNQEKNPLNKKKAQKKLWKITNPLNINNNNNRILFIHIHNNV